MTEEKKSGTQLYYERMANEIIVPRFLFAQYALDLISRTMEEFPIEINIELRYVVGDRPPHYEKAPSRPGSKTWIYCTELERLSKIATKKFEYKIQICRSTMQFLMSAGILKMHDPDDFVNNFQDFWPKRISLTNRAFTVLFQDKSLHPDEIMKSIAMPANDAGKQGNSLASRVKSVMQSGAVGSVSLSVVADLLSGACKGEVAFPSFSMPNFG